MSNSSPTWVKILSIMLLLIGGCSVYNDITTITMPRILVKQKEVLLELENRKDIESADTHDNSLMIDSLGASENETHVVENGEIFDTDTTTSTDISDTINKLGEDKQLKRNHSDAEIFKKMLDVPEKTQKYMVILGYIGLMFSILYIISAILFFKKSKVAIKFLYGTLTANIIFALVSYFILRKDNSLVGISNTVGMYVSVVVDLVLLIVIASVNKFEYYALTEETEDE